MSHPFDLKIADLEAMDLDFVEPIADERGDRIAGGIDATTLALGEEGGGIDVTTLALGEEGGGFVRPIPIEPPPFTTKMLHEEGGGFYTKAWFEGGGGPIYW
ncbi:MAG: hypothetical protein MUE44_00940 [Oscillatoriaceae cyanobacterium Prado104]|jgi:hypothetical protein|nr:hypothetical protein [Oscillatoriaceae cyanobacterium Prado104]